MLSVNFSGRMIISHIATGLPPHNYQEFITIAINSQPFHLSLSLYCLAAINNRRTQEQGYILNTPPTYFSGLAFQLAHGVVMYHIYLAQNSSPLCVDQALLLGLCQGLISQYYWFKMNWRPGKKAMGGLGT